MARCCPNCFDDDVVQEFVRRNKVRRGRCRFCGSANVPLAETDVVGQFVLEGVDRQYETTEQAAIPVEMADHDDLLSVLDNEGLFSGDVKDPPSLVDALLEGGPSGRDLIDGGTDYSESSFVSHDFWLDEEQNAYRGAWDYFKDVVKHERRFFDPPRTSKFPSPPHPSTREEILEPLAELFPRLSGTLAKGTELWRSRAKRGKMPNDPHKAQGALGPPPLRRAGHGRMNPAGIPYLYLASDLDTCIAEARPAVGDRLWVGSFELTVDLKMLDLTAIPPDERKSIFDPTYKSYERWAAPFLKAFSREISKPIRPDDVQLEYVPTQVLAEFIRFHGYDVVKFASSQHRGGFNFTLMGGPVPDDIEVGSGLQDKFTLWMRLKTSAIVRLTGVSYRHKDGNKRAYSSKEVKVEPKKRRF